MTTTTNPYPDVPLPPGVETHDDWAFWGNECRLLWGARRGIQSTNLSVMPSVSQLPDGSIEGKNQVIFVDLKESEGYRDCLYVDAPAARLLAQALLDAADQIDRWVQG